MDYGNAVEALALGSLIGLGLALDAMWRGRTRNDDHDDE